ncbi:sugar ABC transporter substrate-binding protein [Pseudonocardia pini]|uniref:sugar ABC transporter substrate-binding protein n=1 Tax=Pseudonocardia pini TaxID=2758030 RepID=UPI0015F00C86|nr:substrate-binding domain-containing protein [Pseudonocardia pini]
MDPAGFTFPMPTDPVPRRQARVAIISVGQNNPAGVTQTTVATEAAGAMGWEMTVFDSAGDAVKAQNFIVQATESGFDAIIIQSYDVTNFQGAVEAALDRGVTIGCISACTASGVLKDRVIDTGIDFAAQGRLMGANILASKGEQANVIGVSDKEFPGVDQRVAAAKQYLSENCPGCPWQDESIVIADILDPGPPFWTAMLSSNPQGSGPNTVLQGMGDAVAPAMAQTAVQAGRTDITIQSFEGYPQGIALLRSGGYPYETTTAGSFGFQAWAVVDLIARKLAGQPLWQGADKLGSPLIKAENLDRFPEPSLFVPPAQADFRERFTALWTAAA